MKHYIAFLAALLLLFGCAIPGLEPSETGTQLETAPQVQPSQPPEKKIVNATNESAVEKKNYTENEVIVSEEEIYANILPRNISENIGDGQFRVPDLPSSIFQFYAINDGFADSLLVRKGGFVMLVDAGNYELASAKLRKLEITRINALVLTRSSPEAIGGISRVLDDFVVDEVWDNGVRVTQSNIAYVNQTSEYGSLIEKAKSMGIVIKRPVAGDSMQVSGLDVAVLNPQKQRLKGTPEVDAIVLRLTVNNFCMYLLNPTVQEIESSLMNHGGDEKCAVATLFEHGAGKETPSLMIEATEPNDAIISVGANSRGLPSPTTLTRLLLKNTRVWRTDNGTVKIETDGLSSYSIDYDNN